MSKELTENNEKGRKLSVKIEEIQDAFNIVDEEDNANNLSAHLLEQNLSINPFEVNVQAQYQNTLSAIKDLSPKDSTEAMLVNQMVATHNVAMQTLRKASELLKSCRYQEITLGSKTFNTASTLMRTYNMQMEALNKYRGKGQQKITVEHINIADGGKAVIGNISGSTKPEKDI